MLKSQTYISIIINTFPEISRTHNFQSVNAERIQAQNNNPSIAGTQMSRESTVNSCRRPLTLRSIPSGRWGRILTQHVREIGCQTHTYNIYIPEISRTYTFKLYILREFKHKNMNPAPHAPNSLANQRSILANGH